MVNYTDYNKLTWKNGDIIDKDKLNNIENGIKNLEQLTKFNSKWLQNLNGAPFLLKRDEKGSIDDEEESYDPNWRIYYNVNHGSNPYKYDIENTSQLFINSNEEDKTLYNLFGYSNFYIGINPSVSGSKPAQEMKWEITMDIDGTERTPEQTITMTFPKNEYVKFKIPFFINDELREYIKIAHPKISFTVKVTQSGYSGSNNNVDYSATHFYIRNYGADFYRFNEEGELN